MESIHSERLPIPKTMTAAVHQTRDVLVAKMFTYRPKGPVTNGSIFCGIFRSEPELPVVDVNSTYVACLVHSTAAPLAVLAKRDKFVQRLTEYTCPPQHVVLQASHG